MTRVSGKPALRPQPRPSSRPVNPPPQTPAAASVPARPPADQLQTAARAGQATGRVALLNTEGPAAPALASIHQGQILEPGMSGESVKAVQQMLTRWGHPVAETGTLGPTTVDLVKKFQTDRGLQPDGRVGPATLRALEADPAAQRQADSEVQALRQRFFSGNKIQASQIPALGQQIDKLLADTQLRQQLISRYGLDSATNQKALVAVTCVEAGSNGDMGEVMTVVMNRAIVNNLTQDLLGRSNRLSVMDVVNEGNQFASKSAVRRIMNGGDTPARHYRNFRGQAEGVLKDVLKGSFRFSQNASNIYFFNQGGFKSPTNFRIGVHRFSNSYSRDRQGRDIPYIQDQLQKRSAIRW